jgi:DNA mismatch repair protein MLH3
MQRHHIRDVTIIFRHRIMLPTALPIALLPTDVQAQIRSSSQIRSLTDAVEELVRNSLDADAQNIQVQVDFRRGYCCVVDNGSGIQPAAFDIAGCLAQNNCTSKRNQTGCYGHRGQSLAALSALSLLRIESCVPGGMQHSLTMHHSRRLNHNTEQSQDEATLPYPGTRVTVRNLFGNVPVRYKAYSQEFNNHVRIGNHFSDLKTRLVGYLLAQRNPPNLRLCHDETSLRFKYKHTPLDLNDSSFSVSSVSSIIRQAQLLPPDALPKWTAVSARSGTLCVRAAFGSILLPTQRAQFITFDGVPLPRSGVGAAAYDAVNFAYIDPGRNQTATKSIESGVCRSPSKVRTGKNLDQWPSFYIRISTSNEEARWNHLADESSPCLSESLRNVIDLLALLAHQQLGRKQRVCVKSAETKLPGNRPPSQSRGGQNPIHLRSWRRTRSAYPVETDNFAAMLPIHAPARTASEAPCVEEDVRILLDDIELKESMCLKQSDQSDMHSGSAVYQESVGNQATSSWTNPDTGSTIHLSANGFVVPSDQILPKGSHFSVRSNAIAKPRRVHPKLGASLDIAERLKLVPTCTFDAQAEEEIRSLQPAGQFSTYPASAAVEQKITAADLGRARVLSQVNQKFILAMVDSSLFLVDQHAADERVKVERLLQQLCEAEPIALVQPLILLSNSAEIDRLIEYRPLFASWDIEYSRRQGSADTINVTHLPAMIAERCRQQPKVLFDLLRREIWANETGAPTSAAHTRLPWLRRTARCPAGLMELVNSRACRSAIMFNDILDMVECERLVKELSQCSLPFQCAHGRPSLMVLTRLGDDELVDFGGREARSFGKAFKQWIQL